MKLNVHRVAMVQAPAIVNCSLSKHGDWKLLLELAGDVQHLVRLGPDIRDVR